MTPDRPRPVLAPRHPLVEQVLCNANIDRDDPAYWEAQRWGRAFIAARDAWADANRHGRRYADRDAPAPVSRGQYRG